MPKREAIFSSIASSLREFGYPDVSAEMVQEIIENLEDGKEPGHGVVGEIIQRDWESIKGCSDG